WSEIPSRPRCPCRTRPVPPSDPLLQRRSPPHRTHRGRTFPPSAGGSAPVQAPHQVRPLRAFPAARSPAARSPAALREACPRRRRQARVPQEAPPTELFFSYLDSSLERLFY